VKLDWRFFAQVLYGLSEVLPVEECLVLFVHMFPV